MLKFIIMVVIMLELVAMIYGMTRNFGKTDGMEKTVTIIWIVLFMYVIHWMFGFLPRPWV